jgi:hypothetical protein
MWFVSLPQPLGLRVRHATDGSNVRAKMSVVLDSVMEDKPC